MIVYIKVEVLIWELKIHIIVCEKKNVAIWKPKTFIWSKEETFPNLRNCGEQSG